MTISEIAKIAEVSVSTVSKVLNEKDSNISLKTRTKILNIAKEYNYKPYQSALLQSSSKSFTLGLLFSRENICNEFISSFLTKAHKAGYSILLYLSSSSEEEYRNAVLLSNQHIDGIVWEKAFESDSKTEKTILQTNAKILTIDYGSPKSEKNTYIDYIQLGYNATLQLIRKNHKKILCLLDNENKKNMLFAKGFKNCMQEHELFDTQDFVLAMENLLTDGESILHKISAVVCSGVESSKYIFDETRKKKRKIPNELSVIALSENQYIPNNLLPVSYVNVPTKEFAEYVCDNLIDQIEKQKNITQPFIFNTDYIDNGSICDMLAQLSSKIIVLGTINIDCILFLEQPLSTGETIITNQRATSFGGKGLNQAIGAAKLGADVYLIGKIGKDLDGSNVHEFLHMNNVNTDCIASVSQVSTGCAYIYVEKNGESNIIVYSGANDMLSKKDVLNNEYLFKDASFCLLQTEIKEDVVLCAAKMAQKHNVKTILKPAAKKMITAELMESIDIFIPNEKEAAALSPPENITVEAQAEYFRSLGAKTVIITLNKRGCYVSSHSLTKYFPAADFEAVDTTGASDAFICALAVHLSDKHSMEEAIEYANFAAGYSITKQGVPSSLIDKTTVDFYFAGKQTK